MAGDDLIELKFRLFDGTDIGPSKFDSSTTVGSLKESILAQWPSGKEIAPRTTNDLKLINAGRILENNRTLAESRVPVGEVPGCVITMHVVVRQTAVDKNNDVGRFHPSMNMLSRRSFLTTIKSVGSNPEKQLDKDPKANRCVCTIL